MGTKENNVAQAVEKLCEVYRIPVFREQSRVLKVGNRLVFYGTWKDDLGVMHSAGKADYLAHPRVPIECFLPAVPSTKYGYHSVAVPLWIECKQGVQRKSKAKCLCGDYALDHQEHFRKYVTSHGAFHLVCRDSAEVLVAWLREHGVIQ